MSTVSSIPGLLTPDEAAKIIGVDSSQVCRYCREEKLPAKRVGRQWLIKREDARNFIRPPVGNPEFQKH